MKLTALALECEGFLIQQHGQPGQSFLRYPHQFRLNWFSGRSLALICPANASRFQSFLHGMHGLHCVILTLGPGDFVQNVQMNTRVDCKALTDISIAR